MAIDTFKSWYEQRHEYAKRWKERTGGKVIGTFCTYVPEELLVAANMLPIEAGFEVHLESVQVGDLACPECATQPSFGAPMEGWSLIYTRPRQISEEASGRKEELW